MHHQLTSCCFPSQCVCYRCCCVLAIWLITANCWPVTSVQTLDGFRCFSPAHDCFHIVCLWSTLEYSFWVYLLLCCFFRETKTNRMAVQTHLQVLNQNADWRQEPGKWSAHCSNSSQLFQLGNVSIQQWSSSGIVKITITKQKKQYTDRHSTLRWLGSAWRTASVLLGWTNQSRAGQHSLILRDMTLWVAKTTRSILYRHKLKPTHQQLSQIYSRHRKIHRKKQKTDALLTQSGRRQLSQWGLGLGTGPEGPHWSIKHINT